MRVGVFGRLGQTVREILPDFILAEAEYLLLNNCLRSRRQLCLFFRGKGFFQKFVVQPFAKAAGLPGHRFHFIMEGMIIQCFLTEQERETILYVQNLPDNGSAVSTLRSLRIGTECNGVSGLEHGGNLLYSISQADRKSWRGDGFGHIPPDWACADAYTQQSAALWDPSAPMCREHHTSQTHRPSQECLPWLG